MTPSVLGDLWQVVQRFKPGRLRQTISCVRHVGCRDCEDFASVMSNVRLTVIGADLHACGNFAKLPTDNVCLQYRLNRTSVVIGDARFTHLD